ncbi:MAG: nucleoside hydrolase [Pseudomonadota bacterium]
MTETIIIDTDPGIDDAMAIFYAGLHPGLHIAGMTAVFGNIAVETAARNAGLLAQMLGQDIPVSLGAARPRVQEPNPVSDYVHGKEGLGDLPAQHPDRPPIETPAHVHLCDAINGAPGEVTLVPIGPLTNIARALDHDPGIAAHVRRVVLMGGAIEGGNVSPYAEANIWNDPHAADLVFAAPWPVTMVGLDVTRRIVATPDDFAAWARAAPRLGGFLNRIGAFYRHFYKQRLGIDAAQMHDPTALILLTRPELFTVESHALEVIVSGERTGQTRVTADSGRRPVDVVMDADATAVKADFLSVIGTGD